MKRLGEIILVEEGCMTIECYVPIDITPGTIVCTENQSHFGILSSLTSVCIEQGKASQAFGDHNSTDSSTAQNFPHLKNSLRMLGKVLFWDNENSLLNLNQGIYFCEDYRVLLTQNKYWKVLAKMSNDSLEKHIHWLQKSDPLFNLDEYIQQLSKHSRPLAWNAYLQHIEN